MGFKGVVGRARCVGLAAFLVLVFLKLVLSQALAASSVTVSWEQSTSPQVIGYNIYYGAASGSYTNMVAAGNVTSAAVSNLVAGTTYFFAATAVNSVGLESAFSAEAAFTNAVVPPPNQLPTLNSLANVTINENAGLQTVNLSGITSGASNEVQTLTVTANSSNAALIPNPIVSYTSPSSTGSLSFTPVINAYGTTTITVTVNDGGASNNIVTRSFTVTVNPVNQPPTLNSLANMTINENAGVQTVNLSGITSGASNEVQTLTVTANSSNTALIPNPTVSYTSPGSTGSLSFAPVTNAYGATTVTVTVNDGGASNNIVIRSFLVTVNQPPMISSITNCFIAANTQTPPIPFAVSDVETPADSLNLSARSSNTNLVQDTGIVFGGFSTNRTLTVAPLAGQDGNANITVLVSDGVGTNSTTFQVSVLSKPTPPGNFHVVGP